MDTKQIIQKTAEVSAEFEKRGAAFSKKDWVLDLAEEVGELAQAVLIVEGVKHTNDPKKQKTVEDIKDALSDILYDLSNLARDYQTDLFEEYEAMLERLKARLAGGEFGEET
ncbi:hypothetical protein A2W24_06315 [Microgenomates group bacterium RBG_16_45_19]|nr:MAG: hypothetical protein A2W24_06315 [Microgenomates group bacterium RBG_16_45_19]